MTTHWKWTPGVKLASPSHAAEPCRQAVSAHHCRATVQAIGPTLSFELGRTLGTAAHTLTHSARVRRWTCLSSRDQLRRPHAGRPLASRLLGPLRRPRLRQADPGGASGAPEARSRPCDPDAPTGGLFCGFAVSRELPERKVRRVWKATGRPCACGQRSDAFRREARGRLCPGPGLPPSARELPPRGSWLFFSSPGRAAGPGRPALQRGSAGRGLPSASLRPAWAARSEAEARRPPEFGVQ